jgi:hypothetical protein
MKRRVFTMLSLAALVATFMMPMASSAQSGKSPTEPGAVVLPVTTKTYYVRGNPTVWHFVAEATNNTGAEIPQGTKIYWKGSMGTGMFTLFNSGIPAGGKFTVVHLSNPNGPPPGPAPSSVLAWFYK